MDTFSIILSLTSFVIAVYALRLQLSGNKEIREIQEINKQHIIAFEKVMKQIRESEDYIRMSMN